MDTELGNGGRGGEGRIPSPPWFSFFIFLFSKMKSQNDIIGFPISLVPLKPWNSILQHKHTKVKERSLIEAEWTEPCQWVPFLNDSREFSSL